MRNPLSLFLVVLLAVTLGVLAAGSPHLQEAIEHQRELAAESPEDPAVHNDLGNLLVLDGNLVEAEMAYHRALELDATRVSTLFNLGLLKQRQGEGDEALEYYHRALALEPSHAWTHYQIGTIHEARGHKTKALRAYAQAFALDMELAFADVNPHIIDNTLRTEALLHAYRLVLPAQETPQRYDDPSRITDLLAPPQREEGDEPPDDGGPQPGSQIRWGGAQEEPAPTSSTRVLGEEDLDSDAPRNQATPQTGTTGRPTPQGGARVFRPAVRTAPRTQDRSTDDPADGGAAPAPRRFRPGQESTGRLELKVYPPPDRPTVISDQPPTPAGA